MTATLAFRGLPVLSLVGIFLAVAVVGGLARAMHQDAWTTVGRLLAPPGALGRALLPLLLLVAVIALFASQQLGWLLQVASGVALATLVWLLLRGQGTEIVHERTQVAELRDAVSPATPSPPLRTLVLPAGFGMLAAAAFVVAGFGAHPGTWLTSAGPSGVLEYAALILFALAASLRLLGYATSGWRIVTAIAFVLLGVRVLTWAGVLRGERRWSSAHITAGVAVIAVLIVLVAAFIAESLRLAGGLPNPPGQTHRFARAIGLIGACLSAFVLAVALGLAAIDTTHGADRLPRDAFGPILPTAAPAIVDTPGGTDKDLAWTFAPVLHLEHDEDYPPIGVDAFLADATQTGARPASASSAEPLSFATLPTVCPDGGHAACGTISCPRCVDRKKETQPQGFVPQGVLYARIVHRDRDPKAFSGWDPKGDRLATLIQYWIFYGYDRWDTETVIGRLTQEHQGDWEAVSVGLDTSTTPVFVALSAHCGGQVVAWSKIAAAPGKLVDGKIVVAPERTARDDEVTHPIVAVARGSHANYAVSAGNRPPDWGSCKRLPSDALTALSYASNVRDLTDHGNRGWFAYPRDIRVVDKATRPMSYPGAWGDGETITFGHRPPKRTGRGPLSPPLQGRSWNTPIALYFCDTHWRRDGLGQKSDCP